jgi:phosphinothricin acetyltransferase
MIRLATVEDASGMAAIYAPFVSRTAISFEAEPPTEAEMAARVAATLPYTPWLVCAAESGVLGFAYASRHRERAAYRWSVDVSVYIDEHVRRRGMARALYTSLLSLVRLQGFYAAHAGITLPNPASVGLHEALGFVPVGIYRLVGYKLGAWHDVGWWQLPLRERAGEPAPPLTVGEARRCPEWETALGTGEALLRL